MYKIHPKTLFTGQIIQYLPSCQSTNDEASALIALGDPAEGTVVVTDNQTAGRGQRGNRWEATASQNLTCSLLLRPSFLTATDQFWLNMVVSLGVYDMLHPLISDQLRIKWPNDVYVGDRKLGGILIENILHGYAIAWSVAGMGLNINQTEFSYPGATSLQQQSPLAEGYDLTGLLSRLCETIEQRYLQLRAGQRASLKKAYLATLYRYQEMHWFMANEQRFRGMIIDVDEPGRLVIATEQGERRFGFKEVQFLVEKS